MTVLKRDYSSISFFQPQGQVSLALEGVLCEMKEADEVVDAFHYASSDAEGGDGVSSAVVQTLAWGFGAIVGLVSPTKKRRTPRKVKSSSRFVLLSELDQRASALHTRLTGQASCWTDLIVPENKAVDAWGLTRREDVVLVAQCLKRKGLLRSLRADDGGVVYQLLHGAGEKETHAAEVVVGVCKLRDALRTLRLRADQLSAQAGKRKQKAQALLKAGNREAAKNELRGKKAMEKALQQSYGQMHNVEVALETIKSAHSNLAVLDSLRTGNKALNATRVSEDKAAEVMDELGELVEAQDDVQAVVSHPVVSGLSDQDLEAEFQQLQEEIALADMAAAPNVPATPLRVGEASEEEEEEVAQPGAAVKVRGHVLH